MEANELELTRILAAHAGWLRDSVDGRRADLHGANLYGADLHGANLHGADLHGADLHGAIGIIDGGQDCRGHRFLLHQGPDAVRIHAGCHYFTIPEAEAHWASDDRLTNAECRIHMRMLVEIACVRNWALERNEG